MFLSIIPLQLHIKACTIGILGMVQVNANHSHMLFWLLWNPMVGLCLLHHFGIFFLCAIVKTTVDDIKRWREEDKCAISKTKSSGSKCVQYHKTLEALEFTKASPIQSGWSHDYNLHLYNLVLKVHVNPFYYICPQMGSICVLFRSLVSTFYRQFVNVL